MARASVGLDIGHHTVRAVALRRDGRSFAVVGHAQAQRRDEHGLERPLSAVLTEIRSAMPLGPSPCVAHGDLSTLVKYVGTIPLPPDRLQRLLRLELLQAIEASELAADSFPVPFASDELIHCCVLTQPTHAHEALRGLAAVGITPSALHVGVAAVYNATVPLPPVQDEELALLVDIGATTTSVALFGERRLLACRQLPIGGDAFSIALDGSEGPPTQAVEQRKITGEGSASALTAIHRQPEGEEGGLTLEDDHPAAAADDVPLVLDDGQHPGDPTGGLRLDGGGTTDEPVVPARQVFDHATETHVAAPGNATQQLASRTLGPQLSRVAEHLYSQLASSLAWFRTQIHARQITIGKVLLTGGGAGLEGLEAYLERRFALPVRRYDPCDGLTGRAPDRPHEFATAIGLALAAADAIPGTVRLDLTPDSIQRQRLWRTRLVWPHIAAACLVLSAVLAGWTMLNDQWVAEANLESYDAFQRTHDELKAQLDALGREKEGLSEDLRSIAGRIYAGRDLLYTIRALKEQTGKSRELWITSLETVDIAGDSEVRDPSAATAVRGLSPVRNTTGAKTTRRDTAIDRGAVDVEGMVKFDAAPSDTALNRFFEDYKAAIASWQPGDDAPRLFRDDRVLQHVIAHKEPVPGAVRPGTRTGRRPAPTGEEAGRFPFKLRFFFQNTQLAEVTAAKVETDRKATP
jgi:Tfp pilus assembly PilM family ATPase